jgi:hypothetical protein
MTQYILGGVILLIGRYYPVLAALKNPPQKPTPQPPILKRLNITQTILNIVSIAFGISMLIPGIMPGLLNAEIIVVNGLLLFVLAYIVHQIDIYVSAELQTLNSCKKISSYFFDVREKPGK